MIAYNSSLIGIELLWRRYARQEPSTPETVPLLMCAGFKLQFNKAVCSHCSVCSTCHSETDFQKLLSGDWVLSRAPAGGCKGMHLHPLDFGVAWKLTERGSDGTLDTNWPCAQGGPSHLEAMMHSSLSSFFLFPTNFRLYEFFSNFTFPQPNFSVFIPQNFWWPCFLVIDSWFINFSLFC